MSAPTGLGGWIAFRSQIGSTQEAAALAADIGCAWVAPRAGDGALNDGAFLDPSAEIAAYHAAGLHVFPWLYSRPESWRSEVEAFRRLLLAGADGVIIDAEVEWEGQQATAQQYALALREALGPDAFIADAPWPLIGWHPGFPAKEFALAANLRMPQAYWTEIGQGADWVLCNADKHWAQLHESTSLVRPVAPIGVAYGRAELARARAPLCPGELALSDVARFLARYPGLPVSLYSLELMGPDLRDLLRARAGRPTAPPPLPARVTTVLEAQRALVALGFALPRWGADGIAGPETAAAVRAFQASVQLPPTGLLDARTTAALGGAR